MTEIQDVIGTAFIVAEYRARENAEPNPLYRATLHVLRKSDSGLSAV